jgi:hypothetical protein
VVTLPLPADFAAVARGAADFWAADLPAVMVFEFETLALACFAVTFRVVAVALRPDLAAVAAFRTTGREAGGFCAAPFVAARFVLDTAARADFGFVPWLWTTLGLETLTRPRKTRPDDRTFAAAFAVARRVDLLCEVEAMGTALVTVATWWSRPMAGYSQSDAYATATCGYRRVTPPSSIGLLKPVHGGRMLQVR